MLGPTGPYSGHFADLSFSKSSGPIACGGCQGVILGGDKRNIRVPRGIPKAFTEQSSSETM